MKKFVLNLIKLYQKYLSRSVFGENTCRFVPSCSDYTHRAVEKYGVIKGLLKGILRIIKCNPFNKGGFDPLQ